jgi:uncharacterized membrane protein YeaQ/YmgE (transglycosylase-associated protein family)
MDLDAQTILIVGIVGVVAGWLAVVVTGGGLARNLAAGIAGALVGRLFPLAVYLGLTIDHPLGGQVASAAAGALIMIALTRMVAGA